MWFKLLVLLRIPVSVLCFVGYATAFNVWGRPGTGLLGGLVVLGVFVYLGVASIKLLRRRKGALTLAWCLLAVESLGAALFFFGDDYVDRRQFDPLIMFAVVCGVLALWALPNAALLYGWRALFSEPQTKEPDDETRI